MRNNELQFWKNNKLTKSIMRKKVLTFNFSLKAETCFNNSGGIYILCCIAVIKNRIFSCFSLLTALNYLNCSFYLKYLTKLKCTLWCLCTVSLVANQWNRKLQKQCNNKGGGGGGVFVREKLELYAHNNKIYKSIKHAYLYKLSECVDL